MNAERPGDDQQRGDAVEPRDPDDRSPTGPLAYREGSTPRVGAVVLAAGGSSRMGGRNKLLERIGGAPVIGHVVRTVLAGGADPVVVVTGHQEPQVRDALQGEPVELVSNPRWSDGMSSSLAAGVAALEGRVDGALICLGDMPRVTAADLRGLVRAFGDSAPEYAPACVPVHEGHQGNPVLWSRDWFGELTALSGDRGAKALLGALGDRIVSVPSGAGVLMDADTPDALELLRGQDR